MPVVAADQAVPVAERTGAVAAVVVHTVKRMHCLSPPAVLSLTSLVQPVPGGLRTVIIAELREVTLLQMQEH